MFATLQQDVLLMLSTTESLIVCIIILYPRVQYMYLNVTIIFFFKFKPGVTNTSDNPEEINNNIDQEVITASFVVAFIAERSR